VNRTTTANGPAAPATQMDGMELALVNGDLSKLSPEQRLLYYRHRCEAAGLDPRTQPFEYITLSGKLTLYARKAASDQLIANRKLSVSIRSRGYDEATGLYEVECRVRTVEGQEVDDIGVVAVAGLKGEMLANAIMKATTKAKRRTVLSACGLGMLDETEVETIPDARVVRPAQSSLPSPRPQPADAPASRVEPVVATGETPAAVEGGYAIGGPAPQSEPSEAKQWIQARIDEANNEWAMTCGEAKKDYKPLCSLWQLLNGLITKYLEDGLLTPEQVQGENAKRSNRKMGAAIATMWTDDADQTKDDVDMYLRLKQEAAAREAGINLDSEPKEEAPSNA
jgi:hypothetical protein